MRKTKYKYNINSIIEDYINGLSIRTICKMYGGCRRTLSKIIRDKVILLNKKINLKIEKYDNNKFKNTETERYVAIDKNNSSVKIYDVNNKSGKISKYLKKAYNIETPNVYQTHKYFMLN